MPFKIIEDNILKLEVIAIVNFDNDKVEMKDGIAHQLYLEAGGIDLTAAIKKHFPLNKGDIFTTPAYRLNAKQFIHVVIDNENINNKQKFIKDTLLSLLNYVTNNNIKSIAIPFTNDSYLYQYHEYLDSDIIPTINNFLKIYNIEVYLVK
ncbi:MAG: macro domain-containing protein [Bacilli bacterium]|nr:macro domain-containing protein [Bacilli bacterium]